MGMPETAFIRDSSATVTALGKKSSIDNASSNSKEKPISQWHSGQDVSHVNFALETVPIKEKQEELAELAFDNIQHETIREAHGEERLSTANHKSVDMLHQIRHVIE